jgi:hypothetical protein
MSRQYLSKTSQKRRLTLQVKVKIVNRSNSAINDSARKGVGLIVSIFLFGGEEASVMTFALISH